LTGFFAPSSIQANYRPDRVIEVEQYYSSRIHQSLGKVLGEGRYLVSVRVTPLQTFTPGTNKNLPYFQEFEETLDPWENPEFPFFSLLKRVSSVRIELKIDQRLKVAELSSLRDSVLREADLIPGRDEVNISFEMFPREGMNLGEFLLNPILIASFLILFGLLITSFFLSRSLKNIVFNNEGGSSSAPNASPSMNTVSIAPPAQNSATQVDRQTGSSHPSFIELSSSLKEIPKKLEVISSRESFPTLKDMIILEDLVHQDPQGFGYLVGLFNHETKAKIYSLGRSDVWINAFCDVGLPSHQVVMTVERLFKDQNFLILPKQIDHILVSLWRCSKDVVLVFAKESDEDKVLALLSHLPKDFSLDIARKLFPGSWAKVLSVQDISNLDDDFLSRVSQNALKIKPLLDQEQMKSLVEKRDLISYLDTTPPEVEQEIYQAIHKDIKLQKIRPAFYPFYNLESDEFKNVLKSYSLSDIALSSLEISRHLRMKLEEKMTDKQKEMFIEYLKMFDRQKPAPDLIYAMRRNIALWISKTYQSHSAVDDLILEEQVALDQHQEPDVA
jgi:hypothetical protein